MAPAEPARSAPYTYQQLQRQDLPPSLARTPCRRLPLLILRWHRDACFAPFDRPAESNALACASDDETQNRGLRCVFGGRIFAFCRVDWTTAERFRRCVLNEVFRQQELPGFRIAHEHTLCVVSLRVFYIRCHVGVA